MEKKTIFEMLFEKKICFSVCVNINTPKVKGIDRNSRDYFVTVIKPDVEKLKGHYFKMSPDHKNVYLHDLSDNDIEEFKKNMFRFVKKIHNLYGRVYELKGNSFQELYDKCKDKEYA